MNSYSLVRHLSSKSRAAQRKVMIDRIIRVDHAGEFGADRIYAGQYAHMWEQEKHHLAAFKDLLSTTRSRPTALLPFWNMAGYALGAGTALLGKEAAMACTVAVESSITEHYNDQIRELLNDDPETHKELIEKITKFRDEEQEHHDTGLEHDAEQAPFYSALSSVIKVGCKVAIWASERV
ncbi:5-demethoxyubiquinone hydroxylase_ mitochondrial [Caligus rogercresseyi]|uniref:5-demethoxyubiquinone hydroxylase, mitochondrial n=1 Tax=Caligus rogercresseyi TaxID=217165 RepID=A0A7T8HGU2_CALRO|nr:5-demethoxyubiquinone hydroxylase_ mitochondrial [Caligus rogercresseyi]